jgi:RNA polymerase sigma-54 factor
MAPPMPSYRPDTDDLPSLEATLTRSESLFDHLEWQLNMSELTDEGKAIGQMILGNIDADGYIKEPPMADIAADAEVEEELVEVVLEKIQTFDPVGIGARSLAECMLIQAIHYGEDDDMVVKIIRSHLGNLEKKNYQAIARDLKVQLEEVYEAAKVIMEFDPRPGRQYSADEPRYITPDVYVHKVGDKYFVVPNDDGLPKLKISSFYRSALDDSKGAKEYIQDKLRSAQWLIRSIQQRQRTIIKVTESIIKFQREFFDKGIAFLKPLILRDVAEDIGMHESTISRVTTAKYVHTPQGIYELKFFFNSGISRTNGEDLASQAVKSKIKKIISDEDSKKPLSDQKIVEALKTTGIDIARRTVAKYREQMGILSSSKRKQVF